VTQVQYEPAHETLNRAVIGTTVQTSVGWLFVWTSTTVLDGVDAPDSFASHDGVS
jgi:hypothetical protein